MLDLLIDLHVNALLSILIMHSEIMDVKNKIAQSINGQVWRNMSYFTIEIKNTGLYVGFNELESFNRDHFRTLYCNYFIICNVLFF